MPPILSQRTRRRYALTPPWAGDDGDLLNRPRLPQVPLPVAEDDEAMAPVLRRPLEPDPLPLPESEAPMLSRPLELPPLQRRPAVVHSEGRPTPIVFGTDDPEARVMAQRRALEQYQPQKESKKSLLVRTLLGQLRGGLIGEGGSLDTLLGAGGVLDRRGKDRAWQQGQLAQTDEQLGRMRTDRRAGLQDRLLESQVAENEAEAAAKLRAPVVKDIVGRDGRILRPNTQGGYDEVFAPPVKPPTERDPLFKTVTKRDGSTRTMKSTDRGKTWQDVPELEGEPRPNEKEGERRIQSEIAAAAAKAARNKAANLRSNAANLENNAQHADLVEAEKLRAEAQQYRRQAYDADQEAEVQEGKVRAYSTPPTLTRNGKDQRVQSYADQFFKGDYAAAEAAIKKQRGQ